MNGTTVDILFLLVIILISICATVNGFIKEFFGKAAFFGALLAAVLLTNTLLPSVLTAISNRLLARIVSFLIIFIAVFLVVKIIQFLFSKLFSGDILKSLDHSLGFLFGVAEGFVAVVFVMLMLINQPWFDISAITDKSFFFSHFGSMLKSNSAVIKGMAA